MDKVKIIAKLLSVIFFLSSIVMLISLGEQGAKWKGKIEEENGIIVVKNPMEPLSNNARREIHLKEIIRIRDNGKDIIFRRPYNLVVDNNENIYFLSYPHLYKYDKDGNLVFKVMRTGQGPGEADSRMNFTIINDEVAVRAISPLKVMIFGLNGVLKEEIKLESFRRFKFIGSFEDKIYAINQEVSWELGGKTGYVDFPNSIYEFSLDFQEHKKICTFPVKFYFDRSAWFEQAFLEFAIKDFKNLFVVHTSKYKIVRFNLKSKKIDEVITREFGRTKRPKIKKKPGFRYGPDRDYYQDVQKLLILEDNLWAITSEKNEENDWLIDVYDRDGKYVDNFFLCFPDDIEPKRYQSIQLIAWKNFLFSVDQDKEGYYSIAKYRIPELFDN